MKISLKLVGAAALVAVLALGGLAFAYWTQGGSGSGTSSAGTTTAITVNQTGAPSGLYPGGPVATLSGTFDEPESGLGEHQLHHRGGARVHVECRGRDQARLHRGGLRHRRHIGSDHRPDGNRCRIVDESHCAVARQRAQPEQLQERVDHHRLHGQPVRPTSQQGRANGGGAACGLCASVAGSDSHDDDLRPDAS